MITGGFTFRNKKVFKLCYNKLILNKGKVNGEYYADSLLNEAINLKLKCKVFLIDSYISWAHLMNLKLINIGNHVFTNGIDILMI